MGILGPVLKFFIGELEGRTLVFYTLFLRYICSLVVPDTCLNNANHIHRKTNLLRSIDASVDPRSISPCFSTINCLRGAASKGSEQLLSSLFSQALCSEHWTTHSFIAAPVSLTSSYLNQSRPPLRLPAGLQLPSKLGQARSAWRLLYAFTRSSCCTTPKRALTFYDHSCTTII